MTDLRERLRDRLILLQEWREAMLVEGPAAPGWDATPPRRIDLPHICRTHREMNVHVAGWGWVPTRRLLPCLDDPATVGILAALVRQREPWATLEHQDDRDRKRVWSWCGWFGATPGEAWALAYLAVTESEVAS